MRGRVGSSMFQSFGVNRDKFLPLVRREVKRAFLFESSFRPIRTVGLHFVSGIKRLEFSVTFFRCMYSQVCVCLDSIFYPTTSVRLVSVPTIYPINREIPGTHYVVTDCETQRKKTLMNQGGQVKCRRAGYKNTSTAVSTTGVLCAWMEAYRRFYPPAAPSRGAALRGQRRPLRAAGIGSLNNHYRLLGVYSPPLPPYPYTVPSFVGSMDRCDTFFGKMYAT